MHSYCFAWCICIASLFIGPTLSWGARPTVILAAGVLLTTHTYPRAPASRRAIRAVPINALAPFFFLLGSGSLGLGPAKFGTVAQADASGPQNGVGQVQLRRCVAPPSGVRLGPLRFERLRVHDAQRPIRFTLLLCLLACLWPPPPPPRRVWVGGANWRRQVGRLDEPACPALTP
jgi:hypothetical protein